LGSVLCPTGVPGTTQRWPKAVQLAVQGALVLPQMLLATAHIGAASYSSLIDRLTWWQAAVCVCRPKNSYDTVVHGTSRHLNACHTDAPDSQAKWPFTSRRLEQTCIAIVCCPHYASRPRHRCQTGARRVRRPGTRRCRPRTGRPRPRTRATSRPGCPGQPPAAATLWPARPPHLRGARC